MPSMQPFHARPGDVSVKSGHVIAGFEHVHTFCREEPDRSDHNLLRADIATLPTSEYLCAGIAILWYMPTITNLFLPTSCHVGLYSTWDERVRRSKSSILWDIVGRAFSDGQLVDRMTMRLYARRVRNHRYDFAFCNSSWWKGCEDI